MKNQAWKLAIVPALLLTLAACSSNQAADPAVTPSPENTAAPVEASGQPTVQPTAQASATPAPATAPAASPVPVREITPYKNISITDWRDDKTVIVAKANEKLGPIQSGELAGSLPQSLYFFHLDTGEYELIVEKDNMMLGDATLSADNKFLLYSEFSLGDPAYIIMDLGGKKPFTIKSDATSGAMGAQWADKDTVIGPAYSGGAYTATTSAKIAPVEGLSGEGLIVVRQIKDKIYYTSNSSDTLQTLDLKTKEKAALKLQRVGGVYPSPDEEQMLVLQYKDAGQALLLSDTDGSNQRTLAEGAELGGVSWASDQRLVAYSIVSEANGKRSSTLYIYDLAADQSTEITAGNGNLTTAWSPSGRELAYTDWTEQGNNSGVVHLKY
ncbi:hypothetical protein MHI24_21220 [Paenibacillus sp. FSL K6-1096]|uniref:TolB family protein n=1 Tax=Paenibacillus sp. FSL K6-1096 TaxID=2921460 RepID=UPI0030EB7391